MKPKASSLIDQYIDKSVSTLIRKKAYELPILGMRDTSLL